MKIKIILLLCLVGIPILVSAKRMQIKVTGNVPLQSLFSETDADYIIKEEIDLKGEVLKLPIHSVLVFREKGKIRNGIIVGNQSDIKANKRNIIFERTVIKGQWHVSEIYSRWFGFATSPDGNTRNFRNMCALTDDSHYGKIYISKGKYLVKIDGRSFINPNSNTELIIDGNLILEGNDLPSYEMIGIREKMNITIRGRGTLVGDVETHKSSKGEWGMGIDIKTSENISIEGLTIKNFWGDCIYIGQAENKRESYSTHVTVTNVTCQAGRRQGLSLISGKDIVIRDCRFLDTGKLKYTAPGAGIDIEPNNHGETVVEDILIYGCQFAGNYNKNDLEINNVDSTVSISIKKCTLTGDLNFSKHTYNVEVDSCIANGIRAYKGFIDNISVRNSHFNRALPRHAVGIVRLCKTTIPLEETPSISLLYPMGIVLLLCIAVSYRKLHTKLN